MFFRSPRSSDRPTTAINQPPLSASDAAAAQDLPAVVVVVVVAVVVAVVAFPMLLGWHVGHTRKARTKVFEGVCPF